MRFRMFITPLLLPGLFGCAAATAGEGGRSAAELHLEEVVDAEALATALAGNEFIRASADTGLVAIGYDSVGALADVRYSHAFPNAAQIESVEEVFRRELAEAGPASADGWFMVLGGGTPRVELFEARSESRPELRNRRHMSLLLEELARRPGFRGRRVMLDLLVGVHGEVRDVRIAQTSGTAAFDAAMLDAARQAQFTPARLDRFPVAAWVRNRG